MSGHGWVTPNPDGIVARCGGPAICRECAAEYCRKHYVAPGKEPPCRRCAELEAVLRELLAAMNTPVWFHDFVHQTKIRNTPQWDSAQVDAMNRARALLERR